MQRLDLHLSNEDRRVQFREDANLEAVLRSQRPSKLTGFFQLCAEDAFAATLLYLDIPRFYSWDDRTSLGRWKRRKRGAPHPTEAGVVVTDTLGRIFTTTPRAGDLYFLRLLLMRVPGPTSFEDLRTMDDELPSWWQRP